MDNASYMRGTMYAVLYRWQVAEKDESAFRLHWAQISKDLRDLFGGGGSRLHRADNGDMIAYARWPSRECRDLAFVQFTAHPKTAPLRLPPNLKEEIWLELTDDLLIPEQELPPVFHASTPDPSDYDAIVLRC